VKKCVLALVDFKVFFSDICDFGILSLIALIIDIETWLQKWGGRKFLQIKKKSSCGLKGKGVYRGKRADNSS